MQAWEDFIKKQEEVLGAETTSRWLRSLKVVHFDACNLYLEAKDTIHAHWFEEHIRLKVRKDLVNNNSRQIKVHLAIADEPQGIKTPKKSKKSSVPELTLTPDSLDPWMTLEQYVPSINQMPYQLFSELASGSLKLATFNPIFLFGTSGVGKTHLLTAICHALKKNGVKALYARAETFTEHVVSAIRIGQMQEFRKAYRHADVLIIDDVHLFARKNATQEELFHTFNSLHTTGRQIILSSSLPPHLLADIEPRLMSRFEWGLTLPLEKLPSQDLKIVLEHRCRSLGIHLNEDTLQFLMQSFQSNLKSLHRAFDALVLRAHLERSKRPFVLDPAKAKELLADLIEEEQKIALNPQKVVRSVAEYYGIHTDDILGKAQSQDCALPRQIAMHLCRSELNMPFLKIGAFFTRDHSTVMTSVKQVQKRIDSQDKEICHALADIKRRLETDRFPPYKEGGETII